MEGLMDEEDEICGTIATFVRDNGFDATVQTQYFNQPIYIRSLSIQLFVRNNYIGVVQVDNNPKSPLSSPLATIDLNHPDSLDQLLAVLNDQKQQCRG